MITLQDIVNAHKIHGGFRQAARALNIPESTFRGKYNRALKEGVVAEDMDEAQFLRELNLRDQLNKQKTLTRKLARHKLDKEFNDRLVNKIVSEEIPTPSWNNVKQSKGGGNVGTPTLFLSDWHYSEVVQSSQVGGVNYYDMDVAEERLKTTVNNMIDVYKNHLGHNKYPGLVLALGGDMFSGDIHAELRETNQSPSLASLFRFAGELKAAILELQDTFGKVFIPCVAGNHGRLTHKPQFKNAAYTNIDWALYKLLAESLKDNKNIRFYIPDGTDAIYRIYGITYCLTHGDKIGTGGGNGNVGPFGPIIRGVDKVIQQYHDVGVPLDCVIMGHWHQYTALNRWIVNGSGKGYDEFAMGMRFKPEAPVQASWLTHPKYGITLQVPIFCSEGGRNIKTSELGSWVSHFE